MLLAGVTWLCPLVGEAQGMDGFMLTNEIRSVGFRLRAQQPGLTPNEIEHLAYILGHSNYLSRAIETAFRRNDLAKAESLLKEFPGTVDDIGKPYGQPLLYQAAQHGPDAQMKFLLAHHADPNRGAMHDTPLRAAIRFQRWPVAAQLVEAGANPNLTNAQGECALGMLINNWWGALPGADARFDLLTNLLEHGADAFAPGSHGNPPSLVELALSRQNERVGDLLLTNRASPSRRTPKGDTALHLAAVWTRTNDVDFLLRAGFSPDQTNSDGLTPLQLIADSTQVQFGRQRFFSQPQVMAQVLARPGLRGTGFATPETVAEMLLSRGATLDIFCAAGLGRKNELAAMLRSDGSLANARDGCGRTPLHYAVRMLHTNAARLLIRSGAAVSAATTKPTQSGQEYVLPRGTTALHLAALRDSPELLAMLVRAGAAIGAQDAEGNTPLHLSVRQGQTNCSFRLVTARAPLDAINTAGQTALQVAAAAGGEGNVELLLNAGARPGVGLGSNTLVHIAADRGSAGVISVLLRHGLPLDMRDAEGRTPFQKAVAAHHWDAFTLLRSKGANANARDLEGNTALDLAAASQDDSVGHWPEQPFWVRWKREWLARGGVRQRALNKLIQWKMLAAPPTPAWTNTSLTVWLLGHGANPNLTNNQGQTPLHALCGQAWLAYTDGGFTNRVFSLLQSGAQLETPDAKGLSALHVAAAGNASPALLRFLAEHVKRPDALRDAAGRTPVHYAVALPSDYSEPPVARVRPPRSNPPRGAPGQPQLRHAPLPRNSGEDPAPRVAALLAGGLSPNAADNQGRTPLHDAVASYSGNSVWRRDGVLLTLLTNKANVNAQDHDGITPLHEAVSAFVENSTYGVSEVGTTLLLSHGAQPNIRDRQGRTPLHLLASATGPSVHPGGRLDDMLLRFPWDFAARDNAGQTPIHLWAKDLDTRCSACAALFRTILTNRSLVNLTNRAGDTPLHIALRAGRDNTVKILTEAGADPALRNASGESSYRLAARLDLYDMVGEPVRPPGAQRGLFSAIFAHDHDSIECWLKADPSLSSVTNNQGQTPLMVATQTGLTDLAERLLELGAPIDVLSAIRVDRMEDFHKLLARHHGAIPSSWLFEAVRCKRREAVEALLVAGGDIQAADADGHSLAHRAWAAHQPELEDWLRTKGSRDTLFDAVALGDHEGVAAFLSATPGNVNATNGQARTPLLAAVGAGQEALAGFLLDRGASVESRTPEGWTALHIAAAKDLLEIGNRLIQAGADPNKLARGGMGPLHVAAAFGRTKFAELLLEHGANVNLCPPAEPGSFRNTPLHWAAHKGGPEVVKLLLAHGADRNAMNNSGATPTALAGGTRRGYAQWFPAPGEVGNLRPRMPQEAERAEIVKLLEDTGHL